MAKVQISSGARGAVRQFMMTDEADKPGRFHLQTEYDAAPPIAQATRLRHQIERANKRNPDDKVLGVIPATMYMQMRRENWCDQDIMKWLRERPELCVERRYV